MSSRLQIATAVIASVFLVAIIAVVALLVLNEDGGGGDKSETERVIRQILTAGQDPDTDITVSLDNVPDDYPSEIPRLDGAKLIATIRSLTPDGLAFISLYETTKRPGEAIAPFERHFGNKDWEITSISRSEDSAGLQFQQNNGPLEGAINVARFGRAGVQADERAPYQVLVSVIDRERGEPAPEEQERAFREGQNQPLPADFPKDRIPIYGGATVIGSAFAKRNEGTIYVLQLVTKDSQEDVIKFYQNELPRSGWTVDRPFESSSAIELSFSDPGRAGTSGSVSASVFLRETSLTEVTVRFVIGSGTGAAPGQPAPGSPTPAPTPRPPTP